MRAATAPARSRAWQRFSSRIPLPPWSMVHRPHPAAARVTELASQPANSKVLDLFGDVLDGFLRVTEEHRRVLLVEERVVDAGEARVHAPLQDDHRVRLVHVEDRHAV